MALAAIGIRDLSMSAASIGPVKAALLATNLAELRAVIDTTIENDGIATDMQPVIREFADKYDIPYN